jgi:hypothetical protein
MKKMSYGMGRLNILVFQGQNIVPKGTVKLAGSREHRGEGMGHGAQSQMP